MILDFNFIKKLGNYCFTSLTKLQYLYLDSNLIQKLNENSFFNLTNLQMLSLRNNSIKQISFLKSTLKNLKNLITTDLSYNQIENILDGDFDFSLNLKSIDLSSNLIKEIQENSFRCLPNLNSFKIAKIISRLI